MLSFEYRVQKVHIRHQSVHHRIAIETRIDMTQITRPLTSSATPYQVKHALSDADIEPYRVTKRHNTKVFVCDFTTASVSVRVDSAEVWWQRIKAALPNAIPARYKHLNDTHADWREGNPIIWATVKFNLLDESEA